MATPGRIAATLGRIGTRAAAGYDWLLVRALCQRTVTLLLALLIAGLAVFSARGLQQELAPEEDRGVLTIMLSGPDGTGLSYIDRQLEQALKVLQPMVDEGLIRTVFTVTGRWDPNRAQIIAPLVDWSQRSESESQQALSARLRPLHNSLPGAQVRIWGGSGLGLRGGGGVSFAITGSDHRQIAQAADAFAAQIERELPHTRDVQVDFDATQPQLMLRIDRERAADLGVAVDGLELALSALVEGREVATLNVDDRSVPVMLESKAGAVRDPQDLLGLTVRSQGGAAVSLAQFVSFDNGAIAAQLDRLGQRRAVQMDLSLTEGADGQSFVDCCAHRAGLCRLGRSQTGPPATGAGHRLAARGGPGRASACAGRSVAGTGWPAGARRAGSQPGPGGGCRQSRAGRCARCNCWPGCAPGRRCPLRSTHRRRSCLKFRAASPCCCQWTCCACGPICWLPSRPGAVLGLTWARPKRHAGPHCGCLAC